MSNILVSNSKLINIENTPQVPNIGYYNISDDSKPNLTNPNSNSYNDLKNNLTNNCTKIEEKGIYPNSMEEPYNLAIKGQLSSSGIQNEIKNLGTNAVEYTSNQIQYLICQLINSRNRIYNPSDFIFNNKFLTIYDTFNSFGKSLFIPILLIFIITMYFLISGVFSSIDVIANIVNIIQNSGDKFSINYWIGILMGLAIPAVCVIFGYKSIIKQNLEDIEKNNITDNPYGVQKKISEKDINIDYITMILFVLVIFSLIGVLFTIKNTTFSNLFYALLTSFIFIMIAIFIFIMYYFVPFFNTGELKRLPNDLKLFIDKPEENKSNDISYIYSNQTQNITLRKVFMITAICITVLAIIFFKKYSGINNGGNPLLKGFLGSSAILLIPILWVINFLVGTQYFLIYPIFLILIRFVRYILMLILYVINNTTTNPRYSDDLNKTLKFFENYSPPWGLFGIEELKILLGMFGYENLYSKSIISDNNNSYDISNNKFISSGLLYFFVEKNNSGMVTGVIYLLLTLIITFIGLFGYIKVQNIFK